MNFTDSFKKKVVAIILVGIVYSVLRSFLTFNVFDMNIDFSNGFPVIVGFMLGSSGALGCGLGTLISELILGDFTIFSFVKGVAAFGLAYAPYKVWAVFLKREEEDIFLVKKGGDVVAYILVGFIGTVIYAVTNAVTLDVQNIVSYADSFIPMLAASLISIYTVGLIVYAVMSHFNMFGLAKSVKKYPIKTMIHMITLTLYSVISFIIGLLAFFLASGETHQLIFLIPASIFGVLMYVDLMYGSSKPKIVE